ncbi:threonine/serine ThrE exporter family protein [Caloranaerobacter sp. DY30410]|uniref:threonine/serine ThrE exporter family protein n=1 Tax=Caloranaerobacter sp. DY30410 TaxID=3238305 RepID=UPI003CFBFE99
MESLNDIKRLLVMAILAGKIMLKNGAETYRVEDTIKRICKSRNIDFAEAFVTPTGIFLSVEYKGEVLTYIKRIKSIKFDLNKIALVNEFSRQFVNSNMSIDKGFEMLNNIDNIKTYPKSLRLIFGGFAGSFFTLLFKGSFTDFVSTFIISSIVVLVMEFLSKKNFTFFLSNIISSSIVTILSIISVNLGFGTNMDKIIIGSIMLLVPGVAITNAIRDSISGDFLSGISRGLEAIIVATAIAFGVGATLKLSFLLFGGM